MSLLVQCPFCPAQIKVSDSAATTTCPKCFKSFDASVRDTAASGRFADRDSSQGSNDSEPGDAVPGWINPWGAAGFLLTTFGLLSASVIGIRSVTLTLAGGGLALVAVGLVFGIRKHAAKDFLWLGIGGGVSAATLVVTVFAGGFLNRFWGMDEPVPVPDQNLIVAVLRDGSSFQSRPLGPDERVNPVKEAIRQDDIVVRLESVALGPVAERPGKKFLLIHMRLGSISKDRAIKFEGFAGDKYQPTLKDGAGKQYAFLEQRPRKVKAGPPHVFAAEVPKTAYAGPGLFLDYQLVFEPPEKLSGLALDLPCAAWGRKDVCRFQIDEMYQTNREGK